MDFSLIYLSVHWLLEFFIGSLKDPLDNKGLCMTSFMGSLDNKVFILGSYWIIMGFSWVYRIITDYSWFLLDVHCTIKKSLWVLFGGSLDN